MKPLAKMRKNWRFCKGFVLTATILMSVMVSLIAGALSLLVRQESQLSYRGEKTVKAYFLAEAGVSEALAVLLKNWSDKDDPSKYGETTLGKGSYTTSILQPSGRVVIQSVGSFKGVDNQILLEVKFDGGGAFNYGVFSNSDIKFAGGATLSGNLRGNSDIDLKGNALIDGDATASGDIEIGNNVSLTGTQTEGASNVPFPTYDFNVYYNMAQDGGLYYDGDQDFFDVTLTPGNGVIYVNGDVTIKGTSNITGGVIATGSIDVKHSLTQTQFGSIPALMSRDDDIKIGGDSKLNGLVYTAVGALHLTSNATLNGQMITFGEIACVGQGNAIVSAIGITPPGLIGSTSSLKKISYQN